MTPVRTDQEKRDFAKMCVAMESFGADIQGYIEVNWPSYTPRACWYNLQRQYLGRNTARLTEGRKDEKKMSKSRQSQEKTVQMLIEAVRNDQDPYQVLVACGFTNIHSAIRNAKAWCKKNKPDWYPAIEHIKVITPKDEPQETPSDADSNACADGTKDNSTKASETPQNANERQTEGIPQERPVCTCCVPGKPSGVTVPDEIPKDPYRTIGKLAIEMLPETEEKPKTKMKVIEVQTEMGTFRREGETISFRRKDNDKDYNNLLRMTPEGWKQLMTELDDVLEMLEEIEF